MAIISSSLDDSNIPPSRKELRLVDSKIIAEEKINKNSKREHLFKPELTWNPLETAV